MFCEKTIRLTSCSISSMLSMCFIAKVKTGDKGMDFFFLKKKPLFNKVIFQEGQNGFLPFWSSMKLHFTYISPVVRFRSRFGVG